MIICFQIEENQTHINLFFQQNDTQHNFNQTILKSIFQV